MKRHRKLSFDKLENRVVLSASPWQNPIEAMDINHDSFVSPIDALLPINAMNASGSNLMLDIGAPPILAEMMAEVESYYMDANGDGYLSPADALEVINLLAEGEFMHDWHELQAKETHDAYPDSPDNAAQLELDWGYAFIESEINSAYDVDAFQFIAQEDRVAIDVFNESIAEGVVVELLNHNHELIARAEGGDGYQWCEGNIDVPVEVDATYFVMVSAQHPEDVGHYVLDVFQYQDDHWEPAHDSEPGEDVHGDTPNDATALALDFGFINVNSYIDSAEDTDQFSVFVDSGQLSISVYQGYSDDLLRITVTDEEGNLIGLTQGDADGAWIELSVDAGNYYVALDSLDSNVTGYTLDVSHWSDQPWKLDADSEMGDDIHSDNIGPDATVLESTEYDFAQNVSHVDFNGDVDYYQFVAANTFASISVYATDWNSYDLPGVSVYDATGNELAPVLFSEFDDLFHPADEVYVRDQNIFDWNPEDSEDDGDTTEYGEEFTTDDQAEIAVCWAWPGGMYPVTEGETYFIEVNGGIAEAFTGQYSLEVSQFSSDPFSPYLEEGFEDESNL